MTQKIRDTMRQRFGLATARASQNQKRTLGHSNRGLLRIVKTLKNIHYDYYTRRGSLGRRFVLGTLDTVEIDICAGAGADEYDSDDQYDPEPA